MNLHEFYEKIDEGEKEKKPERTAEDIINYVKNGLHKLSKGKAEERGHI